VLLWLSFEFIGQVTANSFNILSFIKLLLMMGVTFTVGIVLIDILDNKKTNSLILSVAIILGLVLNQNIIVSMLTTDKSKSSSSSSTSCNSSNAKSFAVDRLNSTIGTTQFLDLHKDNGDSWLFYGSVYSSRYSRDVTVFILIGCSGGSYSVLNVDVQL